MSFLAQVGASNTSIPRAASTEKRSDDDRNFRIENILKTVFSEVSQFLTPSEMALAPLLSRAFRRSKTTENSLSVFKAVPSLSYEHLQQILKKYPDFRSESLRELILEDPKNEESIDGEKLADFVQRFPNLKSLHLIGCSALREEDLANLKGLHKLESLLFYQNPWFTGRAFVYIQDLSIRCLDLFGPKRITKKELQYLEGLPFIEDFSLKARDEVSGEVLCCIAKLSRLKTLDLRGCSHIKDEDIEHLKMLPIEHLFLLNCKQFTNVAFAAISEMKSLKSLSLSNLNILDWKVFQYIKQLPNLQHLYLDCCKYYNPEHLVDLIGLPLRFLRLAFDIRDANQGLEMIEEMTHLESLVLTGCDTLTLKGIHHLRNLKHLQELSIEGPKILTDDDLKAFEGLPLHSLSLVVQETITPEGLGYLRNLPLHGLIITARRKLTPEDIEQLRCLPLEVLDLDDGTYISEQASRLLIDQGVSIYWG